MILGGFELSEDDGVLVTAGANLWRGAEAVGGRLTLSRAGLEFRAHSLHRQPEPLEIPVDDIVEVRRTRTMGIIPNGLAVTTRLGLEVRFVVGDRDRFIKEIAQLTGRS
jgi:hypothetical protein